MKKTFKFYIVIWVVLLSVYNLAVFLVKPLPEYAINYDTRFWISWGIIIATYIGQLICAGITFFSKTNEKLFLNISLFHQGYIALILSTVFGTALMLIPDCPAWIAAIVCAVIFAISVILVVKAKAAIDTVSDIDTKVKTQTFFIKSLTVDAESLMARAKTDEIKAATKKVCEAIRYSDPMSNEALIGIETQIQNGFNSFADAVRADDTELALNIADELISLIKERNNKVRVLK